ncbi:MAG TPA: hypothetical protein VGO56_12935 [Pyrinomonadaceae bacterium]|nr:hypothetical protein [Pyrinomonadaceae bacterium]
MSAPQTQTDELEKLREMVKDIDFCMLTTLDENGDLHSGVIRSRVSSSDRGVWDVRSLKKLRYDHAALGQ